MEKKRKNRKRKLSQITSEDGDNKKLVKIQQSGNSDNVNESTINSGIYD